MKNHFESVVMSLTVWVDLFLRSSSLQFLHGCVVHREVGVCSSDRKHSLVCVVCLMLIGRRVTTSPMQWLWRYTRTS